MTFLIELLRFAGFAALTLFGLAAISLIFYRLGKTCGYGFEVGRRRAETDLERKKNKNGS